MKPWTETAITKRLGLSYPIIQGPFGRGASSARLAATVSKAGGLGSFGANDLAPADLRKVAEDIRELTDRPFGLNLWVSTFDPGSDSLSQAEYQRVVQLLAPYFLELGIEPPERPPGVVRNFEEQAAALIEVAPAVFSFVFGIPSSEILDACRQKGIVTVGAATIVEEAIALEAAGVDFIVASGLEAGGHRPSFLRASEQSLVGTFALVPQLADQVGIPVIAAGGIADGRGIAAALGLGASAVQIGTAFLACEESGAHPLHRELLFRKEGKQTTLSRAFTGRLARGIENRYAVEMKAHEATLPRYPAQSWITGTLREAAIRQGRTDLLALWAGQGTSLIRHHHAAELFAALVRETDDLLESPPK